MESRIKQVTARVIHQIWTDRQPNKAVLAALRNSRNMMNKNASVVWPLMLSNLTEEELSHNGQPTYAENAIFAALRCFAIYQQANDHLTYEPDGENQQGQQLFKVLSTLRADESIKKALDRRVQTILGNGNSSSVIYAIYHLVSILKANVGSELIDFAQLAQDLYYFQLSADSSRQVCLKWGQQYYWNSKKTTEK
ncbi:type I-E CRISPR-associated protein Cse2/CasB [Limosilactobacillus fastidiosus]|uniref:Type I-E CRISPR-associated protein Cse2/CasB n=1 Tax=Limosilactobacillus fastidiosus TaxID=2759855 RepID=A0ABR6E6N9_9LACO|nr:type I-E CRISPR-associated protein Cse2/CasB [Limosilactobacillus fastidiosus]MBB1062861.1 type I-E CRISPR-associated protein Cse2/CasB [Limosilactobacillus fastidiosus]MCD7084085.1 type I-E CRISPR-associated protein Cse2/CasB [Limosilactobacillus fastidiosus]